MDERAWSEARTEAEPRRAQSNRQTGARSGWVRRRSKAEAREAELREAEARAADAGETCNEME